MRLFIIFPFLLFSFFVLAHEDHKEKQILTTKNTGEKVKEIIQESRYIPWIEWTGSFHLIFLHFPIALINMLALSELLWVWHREPIFEFSSRFLLLSTAVLTPPTAFLGLIYSYSATYSGLIETFLEWHMWFGIFTAILAVIISRIREQIGVSKLYYACLFVLFLMVNITGFFGGGVTFGPFHMYPPL